MTEWIVPAVMSGLLGLGLVPVSTYLLHVLSFGNPRAVWETSKIVLYLRAAPPTTVFQWQYRNGLHAIIYDAAEDEEKVKPVLFQLDRYAPTFMLWGFRPRSAAFAVRRARLDLWARLLCFLSFLPVYGWLIGRSLDQTPLWWVLLAYVLVHQAARWHTNRFLFPRGKRAYVLAALGVFGFLQGGILRTVAVCAVGGFFVLATLSAWWALKNRRIQDLHRRFPEWFDELGGPVR